MSRYRNIARVINNTSRKLNKAAEAVRKVAKRGSSKATSSSNRGVNNNVVRNDRLNKLNQKAMTFNNNLFKPKDFSKRNKNNNNKKKKKGGFQFSIESLPAGSSRRNRRGYTGYRFGHIDSATRKANKKVEEKERRVNAQNREAKKDSSVPYYDEQIASDIALTANVPIGGEGRNKFQQAAIDRRDQSIKFVQDIFEGKYFVNVTQEEIEKWEKENYTTITINENGKKVKTRTIKANAVPPPLGREYTKEEEAQWNYAIQYLSTFDYQVKVATQEAEYLQHITADYSDVSDKTSNSLFDIFRDSAAAAGKSGDLTKFWTTFGKGVVNYANRYIWSPIKSEHWGVLLNNTLVNLSETMDVIPISLKTVAQARTPKYVKGMGQSYSGQEAWVYSGGYKNQKKLLKLGVGTMFGNSKPQFDSAEDAFEYLIYKDKIEEKGLKDEFIKMYNEFFEEGGPTDAKPVFDELFKTYTTHRHVDVDTGHFLLDIAGEMVLDPSLLVGGFASNGAKASARSVVKSGVKNSLEQAAKNGDEFAKVASISDRIINRYVNDMGNKIYSRGKNAIDKDIRAITEDLIRRGQISEESRAVFSNVLLDSIHKSQDTATWKVVRSLHYVDRVADAIDSALLKSVFAVPYLSVKLPKTGYKLLRKTKPFRNRAIEDAVRKAQSKARIVSDAKNYTVADMEAAYNAVGKEYMTKEGSGLTDEVTSEFVVKAEKDRAEFRKFQNALDENADVDEAVDDFVEQITEGKYRTEDELKLKLEELTQKKMGHNDDLDVWFKEYQKLIDDIDLFKVRFKNKQIKKYFDDIDELFEFDRGQYTEAVIDFINRNRKVLSNNFVAGVEEVMARDIDADSKFSALRGYIQNNKATMKSSGSSFSLGKNLEDYKPELFKENVFTLKNRKDIVEDVNEIVDRVNQLLKDERFESSDKVGITKDLRYILNAKNHIQDFSVETLREELWKLQRRYKFKAAAKQKLSVAEAELVIASGNLLNKIESEYLSTTVNDFTELIEWQQDKLVTVLNSLNDVNVKGFMSDILDPNTQLGNLVVQAEKYMNYFEVYSHPSVKEFYKVLDSSGQLARFKDLLQEGTPKYFIDHLKGTVIYEPMLNLMSALDITDPAEIISILKDKERLEIFTLFEDLMFLKNEAKSWSAFMDFVNSLEPEFGRSITSEERWAVLDSMFNFTSYKNAEYTIVGSDSIDHILDNAQLWLDSIYGNTKASTDGFTEEVLDFGGEMWAKTPYVEEVQLPEVQEALKEFVSGGHVDPMSDVNKQMLMSIVKDPEGINYYNSLFEKQEVLFVDIETQGMNKYSDEITAIAYKKWTPIDEDASLMEILDILKNSEGETFHSYLAEKDIVDKVSNEVLELNYGKRLDIAPTRQARLEQYLKDYSVSASKDGKMHTEKELLSEFMGKLDTIYLGKTNSMKAKQNPVIVTHNNNGFDMDYISTRAAQVKEFPNHIQHLGELREIEVNSLRRVKQASGDPIILKETRDYIRDRIYSYAKEINSYKVDMNVTQPSKIIKTMRRIENYGKKYQKQNVSDILMENKTRLNRKINDPDFGDFMNSFEELINSDYWKTDILGNMKDVNNSLRKAQLSYKDNITINPFHMTVYDLDNINDDMSLIFTDAEKLQIEEAIKVSDAIEIDKFNKQLRERYLKLKHNYDMEAIDNPLKFMMRKGEGETGVPPAGYKKLFSGKDVKNYFTWDSKQPLTLKTLRQMEEFSKYVGTEVTKHIKDIKPLEGCKADFDKVIQFCQTNASQLGTIDEFSYFKYLRVPDTLAESYVMAQRLWSLLKFNGRYKEVMSYVINDVPFDSIPDKFKSAVTVLRMDSSLFDIGKGISRKATLILDNRKNKWHPLIKRNAPRSEYYDVDVDWLEDAVEAQALIDDFSYNSINLENFSMRLENLSKYADDTDYAIKVGLSKIADIFRYISEELEPEDKLKFRVEEKALLRKMYDLQSAQILGNVTTSEDALISHLLFHNHNLLVAVEGSEEYMTQVNVLKEMLNKGVDHVVFEEHDGFLDIWLAKGSELETKNSSRWSPEETEIRFKGEEKSYKAPKYDRISIGDKAFSNGSISEITKEIEDSIDFLTEGAARGSVGVLYNLNRHMKRRRHLPKSLADKVLSEDVTCDARFWHGASFDMSVVGDYDHRAKFGNEVDLLMGYATTYKEIVSKVKAERLYLDSFFNNETIKLDRFFKHEKVKDVIKAMDNAGYVAVVYSEGRTASGYRVDRVNLTDELSVEVAKESGAVLLPYDVYVDMVENINESKATNTFFKVWTKYLAIWKTSVIASTGTFIRNYLDATVKAVGDVNSLSRVLKNQITASRMLHDYWKINKFVDENRGINYKTSGDVKRLWSAIKKETKCKINYEQYEFLDWWFSASVSGGETTITKSVMKARNTVSARNNILREGSEFDWIASQSVRFANLSEETVEKLLRKAKGVDWDLYGSTEEEFWQVFRGEVRLDAVKQFKYDQFCETLLDRSRWSGLTGVQKLNTATDKIANMTLTPMSVTEKVVRLSEALALADEGYGNAQIFKKITDSQFNYDLKSDRVKYLETIIPFYNFMSNNVVYWCKQISENPRMIRYLENFWGPLSWDDADESNDEYVANKSVQEIFNNGRIPIGKSGLNININPSFLDAMNWVYRAPETILGQVASPFQPLLRSSMKYLGWDSWALWDESSFWSNEDSLLEGMVKSVPWVGTIYNRVDYLADSKPWTRLLNDADEGVQGFLVKWVSTFFGADYPDYQGFEEFKAALKKQGKWWDNNEKRIRDLSEKNSLWLNDPDASWEEKQFYHLILFGEIWDRNKLREDGSVGDWTTIGDYEWGGLNREFDFDNPQDWALYEHYMKLEHNLVYDNNVGEWVNPKDYSGDKYLNSPNLSFDDLVYYYEKLRGLYWDNNQGAFVPKDKLTQGGLNSDNLSFTELQILQYAIHGKTWSNSEGKFVETTEPVVGFALKDDSKKGKEVKPERSLGDKISAILGIDTVYASSIKADKEERDFKYVITGDPEKDAKVYRQILKDYAGVGNQYSKNYTSGYAGGKFYRGRSYLPKRRYIPRRPKGGAGTGNIRNINTGVRSGGKLYGRAYSSGKGRAGLRMATSNYPAYDRYYQSNKEYNYNYQYKNPVTGVANYPQTKLGIDRYMGLRQDALNRKLLNYNKYNLQRVSNRHQMGIKQRLQELKLTQYRR